MDKLHVIFFASRNRCPITDILRTFSPIQRAKVHKLFERIEQLGIAHTNPYIKKLTSTPFWEARILGQDNIRALFVHTKNNSIVILHIFIKKTEKTPTREIDLAMKRYSILTY